MMRLLRLSKLIAKLPTPKSNLISRLAGPLTCLLISILFSSFFTPAKAKTDNVYDLIGAVNQLRTANGLPPYEINASLMASAQSHSDYQASIGTITHTGVGGSSAKSRAIAAGYGGGTTVYVSENIAGGTGMTYQQAVQMWQGDSLHLNTMLGSSYTDVGAGIAYSGDRVYFTLDVGYIAGAAGSGVPIIQNPSQPSAPTAIPYQPIVTSTPAKDGSVTHKVQSGQTLWAISAIYQVSLPEILTLNGFNDNTLIFPGNEILIKPASIIPTPQMTLTDVISTKPPTQRPTETIKPTQTAPMAQSTELAEKSEKSANQANTTAKTSSSSNDPALYIIAALIIGGTTLLMVGYLLKKQTTSNDDT